MSDDKTSVDRIATKQTVEQLWRHKKAMNSRVGEERATFGAKVEQAVESKFLDKKAFDMATKLAKLESGKAAKHFRNLMIYCEHLGVGDQRDLEDEIADREREGANPVEEATEKFDQGKGIRPRTIATANPKKALAEFKDTLMNCKQARSAQSALQKFVSHHQDLAEEAEQLTAERVAALAEGKKPRSPSTEAARDMGIGAA